MHRTLKIYGKLKCTDGIPGKGVFMNINLTAHYLQFLRKSNNYMDRKIGT